GFNFSAFAKSLNDPPPVSIRLNPYKTVQLNPFPNSSPIPWNKHGRYLDERPIFTFDPAFHAGAYYVQEASSMLVLEALRQWLPMQETPLRILDLCAAPGGKTTLLSQLGQQHLIVANEVIKNRFGILRENLQRWGTLNKVLTNCDVDEFKPLAGYFDIVLIDAPCSGEGLWRKDHKAVGEWSPDHVQLCAARQRRILSGAQALVREGGILLYCTCTYNQQENQHNVEWLQQTFNLEGLQASLPAVWGVEEQAFAKSFGYQCYPHRVKGEGFFFAGFRQINAVATTISNKKNKKRVASVFTALSKKERHQLQPYLQDATNLQFFYHHDQQLTTIQEQYWDDLQLLGSILRKHKAGLNLGSFKKNDFVPDHELALAQQPLPNFPVLELDKQSALLFLKREPFLHDSQSKGWHLVRYEGLPLGWVKVLPNRINNYLPKGWRI
ncbi:MAG: RNA methyltransferase, partial [Bacteroidota bacterium]